MTKLKHPGAVSLGRLGGKARAKKLSKEELSKLARKAVLARWAKAKHCDVHAGQGIENAVQRG